MKIWTSLQMVVVGLAVLACSVSLVDANVVSYSASQVTNHWVRGLDGNPNPLSPPWTHRTPADPMPFGFANNLDNNGWIPPLSVDGTNNPAALPMFEVDFGEAQAITGLRAYSTFAGGSRGMELKIDHSDDGANWSDTHGHTFQFTTEKDQGTNDAGDPETGGGSLSHIGTGFGGWYEWGFNGGAGSHQHWRISSTGNGFVNGHGPRIGELEFLTIPEPSTLAMTVLGVAGLAGLVKRRRRR